MIASAVPTALLWLQGLPPRALVLGMTIAYLMCFAGLVFAYLNYRRRRSGDKKEKRK